LVVAVAAVLASQDKVLMKLQEEAVAAVAGQQQDF
jgi:hypothetical protein